MANDIDMYRELTVIEDSMEEAVKENNSGWQALLLREYELKVKEIKEAYPDLAL